MSEPTAKKVASTEYVTWTHMWDRCCNPRNHNFVHYGARGIRVCERWAFFSEFLGDMGEKPDPTYSLDRIDPYGDYEPGNCRWADRKTQARNKRRRLPPEAKAWLVEHAKELAAI